MPAAIYIGPDGRGRTDVWIDVVRNELGDADNFGVFIRNPLAPETGVLVEKTPQYWYAEVVRDQWLEIERSL